MRTQDEIVKKIEEGKDYDFLGTKLSDLIVYLDYEHACSYLNPEVTKENWIMSINNREAILAEMLDYMSFAWEKANGCRGLSTMRSMDHYSIWIWLLGDEEIFKDLKNYEYYGKDNLVKICQHYGWDSSQWDDNIRVNSEREL